jgi:hypothetical protein
VQLNVWVHLEINGDSSADLRKEKIMKKVFTMSILIFLIFLVAGGCQQKTRRIVTGEPVVVTTQTIGPEGGTITITKEGDPLNGYSITVPSGAYTESLSFTVSYSPILNHTYGENFNPIAPLITVENGGGYAKKSMIVKIPVEVPDGYFAMAFFYDDKTGELQGVPMRKSEKNMLTVATRHFSNMAVSSAAKKVFEGEIPSGFKQGVDNWQFTNWGSYVAAGGQCAGQTIAAMYYFSEKKVKEKKPSLYGLYDNYNNPYQKTPDIEFDDVLAYRLCSMAQEEAASIWAGEVITDVSVLLSDVSEEDLDPESTFHAFAGSMVVSDMPQLMGVDRKDKNGKTEGHALIVYKCSGNELYVSDPNYPSGPGSAERKVIYDPVTKQFKGYDSGRNAEEARQQGVHYDIIEYLGAVNTFDTAPMKKLWKEFEDGTIGDGTFPRYTVMVEETFPDGSVEYVELVNNYETTNKKIKVKIEAPDIDSRTTLYKSTGIGEDKGETVTNQQLIEIPLTEGINSLGFHVEGQVKEGEYKGIYRWVGFTWVNVILKKAATTTSTTATGNYTCAVVKPESGANITYVPDKTEIECRAKIYLDGKDVTEQLNWAEYNNPNQIPPLYAFYVYYLFHDGVTWTTFRCYDTCLTDAGVVDGLIGSNEFIIPRTGDSPPDVWPSKVKFVFTKYDGESKEICECTSDQITFTKQQ